MRKKGFDCFEESSFYYIKWKNNNKTLVNSGATNDIVLTKQLLKTVWTLMTVIYLLMAYIC